MGERIAFAIAAAGALGGGIAVISVRSPFRAAVAAIVALMSVALLFLLMAAPFVAAIQVIVYAGAIVVLFLFVIAYLGDRGALGAPDRVGRWRALGIVGVLGLVAQGALLLDRIELPGANDDPRPTDTIGSPEAIGHSFIDDYIVPFEATSLLLLVAAVAAVMLAKKAIQSEGGR